jgi:hypothetical protein
MEEVETIMVEPSCSLCGKVIPTNPSDIEDSFSDEHAPPSQFYPKSIKTTLRDSLWKVPSHRRCNGSYQKDEDYFYHRFYPLVAVQNGAMGKIMLDDVRRRSKKPQTRVMLRHMLKECKNVSPGGIILPPTLVKVDYEVVRIQRVVVKITQCLFHKDHQRFLPRDNCEHIELCENPANLQEIFV